MSSEEERAQRSVERMFPEVARFLAAERGGGPVPVFGPTDVQNVHDDQPEPHVTVCVAYRMSRVELFAGLAIGYATTNIDRSPDSMTVEEIRYDVEGYLADTSLLNLSDTVETVAGMVERGEHPEQTQALKRALDRAYPSAPAPAAVQAPRYGDGTVALQTLDRGEVVVDEPAWCVGHDGEPVGHRADITHNGASMAGELEVDGDTVEFLRVRISHAPLAELQPELRPVADVEGFPALDAEQLRELAAKVGAHAGRLYSKANELDRLRRAES
ncbi:DUF6907 domain-containing protein [Streptomyces europaeiscabiei]|uniref:DUF6907 domain-containing protein n=1 Tax=Streptomyces europaeiscabiei TaxID=146819 RepID=UPI0029BC5347|nr:hypothetical protein [Streptomyces europaeiscabiei]MDX3582005.1 hypothetical protein [Streptomyces europaeiscabiei]